MKQIVRLYSVPLSIVSDRVLGFTSHFRQNFLKTIGSKISTSTSFYHQIDGQSKRTIQMLEDLLRSCDLTFVEFAYNYSFLTRIGMTSFKALRERRFRTFVYWGEIRDRHIHGSDLVDLISVIY